MQSPVTLVMKIYRVPLRVNPTLCAGLPHPTIPTTICAALTQACAPNPAYAICRFYGESRDLEGVAQDHRENGLTNAKNAMNARFERIHRIFFSVCWLFSRKLGRGGDFPHPRKTSNHYSTLMTVSYHFPASSDPLMSNFPCSPESSSWFPAPPVRVATKTSTRALLDFPALAASTRRY